MAKKGQKFNKYSPDLKEKILDEYFATGISHFKLDDKYGLPRYTVRTWIRKAKKGLDIRVDHRGRNSRGRSKTKNLTLEDYKERYEILKKYQAFLQARRGKK